MFMQSKITRNVKHKNMIRRNKNQQQQKELQVTKINEVLADKVLNSYCKYAPGSSTRLHHENNGKDIKRMPRQKHY